MNQNGVAAHSFRSAGFMRRVLLMIALGISIATTGRAPARAAVLLGADGSAQQLLRLDLSSGAGSSLGSFNYASVAALTWDPGNSILYGSSSAEGTLLRIDPRDASVTVIGSLGVVAPMHGLEFNPLSGVLYGSAGSSLYSVNVATGQATLIGNHGVPNMSGLAFDPVAGLMYASTIFRDSPTNADALFTLDLQTAQRTLIGNFGGPGVFGVGRALAYDPELGLYSSDPNRLWKIDPATAGATLIGQAGATNLIGLAFVPESAIPEPAGSLCLLAALAGTYVRRRRSLDGQRGRDGQRG